MRRDPTLQPLSRDHHHTLKLARRLQKKDDHPEALRASLSRHWPDMSVHFATEERLCEQALGRCPDNAVLGDQVARMRAEHREIEGSIRRLLSDASVDPSEWRALGDLLIAHVRFEERELFNRLQDGCLPSTPESGP